MRRARRALLATVTAPPLLVTVALVAASGVRMPAALARVIERIYDQDALPPLRRPVPAARAEDDAEWATVTR
jgi:hypothetical protein